MQILIGSEPVNPDLLSIKSEAIVKALGVPPQHADSYLLGLIDDLLKECLNICSPRAAASCFDNPSFSNDYESMTIEGVSFNLNKMVASSLRKSTSVAFFAGTCGEKTGAYSAQLLKNGHALEGLIVDCIGTEIAEGVADYIHVKIEAEMKSSGSRTTNRYSPGYCNWPVSDQQKLFALLGENNCGILLTASCLMLPIKSVSGIVGLGKDVINTGYACSWCDAGQCLYRDRK